MFIGILLFFSFGPLFAGKNELSLTRAERQWLENHPKIILGAGEKFEPLVIVSKNGSQWGFLPDFIQMINALLGTNIVLKTGPWTEIVHAAKAGKIDGLAHSSVLDERSAHFLFTNPYHTLYQMVYVRRDNQLKISSLNELAGKKVGIEKGVRFNELLLQGYPGIIAVQKRDIQELLDSLQKEEIDAAIFAEMHDNVQRDERKKEIKPIFLIEKPALELSISIRKDWSPLVSLLNKALDFISVQEKSKLAQKWASNPRILTTKGKLELTALEWAWLAEHPRIKIAPDPFFPPIEFFDQQGNYQGIAADYMKIIEELLNIRFEPEQLESWDDVLASAREKRVDILPAAANTTERQEYLNFSEPHLVFPGVIIASTKSAGNLDMTMLKSKKIGVVAGYVWQEYIKRDFPSYPIVNISNIKAGLKEVSLGNLDALVATLPVAVYYIEKEGITNLRVAGETGYYTRLSIGVRKDWPILTGIINKTLSSISLGDKKSIYQKWVYIKSGSLLESSEFWLLLTFVILGSGVILLLVLVWNFTLKRQVAQKTGELETELLQRSRTEAQLRASESQNRALLEAFPDKIFRIRQDGLILDYKGPDEHLAVPRDKVVGVNLLDTPLPEEVKKESLRIYKRVLETGKMEIFEYQLTFEEENHVFEARIVKSGPDEITSIVRNMTSEKKIQNMLLQNEKMISIGRLAAGMAHEINNPLGVVLQGVQNSLRRLSPEILKNQETAKALGISIEQITTYLKERKIITYLQGIQKAGKRAAEIVHNMLAFARNSSARKEYSEISRLIDNALELISNDYNMISRYDFKKIKVIKDYEKNLPLVPCIANELEQVLLNLIKNAAQAMETDKEKPPRLEIKVKVDGKTLNIVVSDNGPGISPEIQKKIFEPFFTTKDVGQGTGLGLSVSYYIITENHQGKLWLESSSGKGAAFTIQLPLN